MLPNQTVISEDFHPNWFRKLLIGFLSLLAVLQIIMVFRFEVNWDEFFLLDWVYKWNNDDLNLVLQTIYFRAFSWLPRVSENEVSQIIAARLVMLLSLTVCCGFMYSICRKFANVSNALISLIFFLSMTFVFRNATSFRVDMLVITFLMSVLWLLITPYLTWKRVLSAGFLLAFAGMLTVKSIFYVPIILVILFAHWAQSKWKLMVFVQSSILGMFSIFCFLGLYFLHSQTVTTENSSVDYLIHASNGSVFEAGFLPVGQTFYYATVTNPFFFIFLLGGLTLSFIQFKKSKKWSYIAATAFIFPLLTVVFYSHAYAYFYTFMLAPATLLIAIALQDSFLKKNTPITFGVIVVLFLSTLSISNKSLSQNLDVQKQVLTTIHKTFPPATTYIDRCAMVSSYPKAGLFMSGWIMGDYYKKNEPIMEGILTIEQPKFILANIEGLNLNEIDENTRRRFLQPDEILLKENYISHWGPIYVAGKSIDIQRDVSKDFRIFIEGNYGIESTHPVTINGKLYLPGSKVDLKQEIYKLSSTETQNITLRWESLETPHETPPTRRLFSGFFPVKLP